MRTRGGVAQTSRENVGESNGLEAPPRPVPRALQISGNRRVKPYTPERSSVPLMGHREANLDYIRKLGSCRTAPTQLQIMVMTK